jgi:aspartyl-tRNA(Asn)/glutamyl-tRNA(Gln) amidotransferase subunit A
VTIVEMAAALRAGKVSSNELTLAARSAIERLNPALNAFLTLTLDDAYEQCRQADLEIRAGKIRGPLHGVPIAHKDLFCTRGVRTTAGSRIFENFVPDFDAAVVARLREAGAVMIGKTNLHECAYGITSTNPYFGAVRNPWDAECIPGGSSGGAGAAVASGIVPLATGTDTGGSIRVPASFCGIVGLKPTFGRVSRYGCLPLGCTLDHMGPLTSTVRDAAIALDAMAGFDPRDPTSSRKAVAPSVPPAEVSLTGIRMGVAENFFFDRIQDEVNRAVRKMTAVGELAGAELETVRVPDIAALNVAAQTILLCEAASVHRPHLHRRELYGKDVLALLEMGSVVPAVDYLNAQRVRRRIRNEFLQVFRKVDCVVVPTTPTPAPKIGQLSIEIGGQLEDTRIATTRLVRGVNALGLPALSLPCGFSSDGLPLSLQLIGRPFEEALILRVGAAMEDGSEFRQRRPAHVA